MLGIPEFQPCFQPVFLFAFSTLTIAAYLRCQQPLFLLGTPLYFLFLIYNDPTYETALLSFHARFNACIIASAVIMNQSKRWRNSPTVKVAATIITEDAFSNTLVLSMSVMSYFVQRTATSLAMIPYPLQVVIQVVCAAFSLTLFYALVELALSQMAKFCFGIEFQKYRTTDNVVVLWRKVCAWHEKLSRENVSGNVQRLEDGKERKD
ncbi:hypothetical protein BCR33DRAFT_718695 [Rhizoclosmatium globosum]|uniref:Uncharacterized protein n=1 Tax=Rhizoclosmatium globosum TaxID=329046 RepID=A0A1Y2C3C7_9FUNG|nr:hypothetical protein BCR33DRAFT_718695 [Rhizoclosmatium globosum]|eukprot:ORY41528.1 hypothetical protein BCR33DRAFT_718695 [Rhizoclosmatium globosum]